MSFFNIKEPVCRILGLGILSIFGILFTVFFPFSWEPSSQIVRFIDTFYMMSPNHCRYGQINGVNILGYAYGSIISLSILFASWESREGEAFRARVRRMLHVATWGMVLVISFFQVKFQIRQFAYEYKYFQGTDLAVKYEEIYKQTFDFARYCQSNVFGNKRAVVKSDLDLEKGEGFFRKTELAYFLYPINILEQHEGNPDVIIVYKKKNPLRALPPGYVAYPPFDCDSLVAVRQEVP
jgi:hypothetical protein